MKRNTEQKKSNIYYNSYAGIALKLYVHTVILITQTTEILTHKYNSNNIVNLKQAIARCDATTSQTIGHEVEYTTTCSQCIFTVTRV